MSDTIFGKIVSGEIPSEFIYEDDHCVAINDISPQAPVHVLVIPKGPYVNADHFGAAASAAEAAGLARAIAEVARATGLSEAAGGRGYRLLANSGEHGRQDVPHYHVHIVGGEKLGRMLPKRQD